MDLSDLNANFIDVILYYCDQKSPGARFLLDASNVMTIYNDQNSNVVIGDWLLDASLNIPQPTVPDDLLGYSLDAVNTFILYKYQYVADVAGQQGWFHMSAADIALMETTRLKGCIVFNDDAVYPQIWTGTAWENLASTPP